MIRPAGRTRSRPKAASTRRKTMRTTAILFGACFTTRSKAATSALGKPTFTAWRRSRRRSSIIASPKECHSPRIWRSLDNRSFGGAGWRERSMPRPNRPAAFARRLSGLDAASGKAASGPFPAPGNAGFGCHRRRARGITCRNLLSRRHQSDSGDARGSVHRRLRQCLLPSTNAINSNANGGLALPRKGAYFANPCYTQIHPTCIPRSGTHQSKLTLMSESLRNDGRVWVPKTKGDKRPAESNSRFRTRLLSGTCLPLFGNLAPRDVTSAPGEVPRR